MQLWIILWCWEKVLVIICFSKVCLQVMGCVSGIMCMMVEFICGGGLKVVGGIMNSSFM